MVRAMDIVRAAEELVSAPYRTWQEGDPVPMWLADGAGNPPSAAHLHSVGVNSSDLINFALELNGLPAGGGTGSFANYLVNTATFDPSSPAVPGAIALRPYEGPDITQQGHIALYLGPHQIIQSIPSEGVTPRYTDEQTYAWASEGWPQYGFTIYGYLSGVVYDQG